MDKEKKVWGCGCLLSVDFNGLFLLVDLFEWMMMGFVFVSDMLIIGERRFG